MARGSCVEKETPEEIEEDVLNQELETYISQIEPVAKKVIKTVRAK